MNNLTMFEITETPDNQFLISCQGKPVEVKPTLQEAQEAAGYYELRNQGFINKEAMEMLKRK